VRICRGKIDADANNAQTKLTRKTPPVGAKDDAKPETACEYPIAFQLLPVSQYRRNSVKTQTNGANRNAHEPKRRRKNDVIAANKPGKIAATAVTQNRRKYARRGGNPA